MLVHVCTTIDYRSHSLTPLPIDYSYSGYDIEDAIVLNMQYKGIRSGVKQAFHFHDTEIMCRHLIHSVQQFIRNGKVGEN